MVLGSLFRKPTVSCRKVYVVKVGPDGRVDRLEACLIAKGYTKIFRFDYSDIFSQLDIKNVFPMITFWRKFIWSNHLICCLRGV